MEFEEPCTRKRIGSAASPAFGAPTRLRHRLSFTSPFLAQYSALQIGPSLACATPAPVVCAVAADARPEMSPAPTPTLLRTVRRASGWSGGDGLRDMASSLGRCEHGAHLLGLVAELGADRGVGCRTVYRAGRQRMVAERRRAYQSADGRQRSFGRSRGAAAHARSPERSCRRASPLARLRGFC